MTAACGAGPPWADGLVHDDGVQSRLPMTDGLRAAWLRRLASEWEGVNWAWGLGLRRPDLRLHAGTARWGWWDGERRVLSISERQVACYTWDSVVTTLKHEIAHQVVHESFAGLDDGPHGPRFRSVCERLGIHPGASGGGGEPLDRPAGRAAPDDARLRRIRKLLALADDGANEHESQAAMARAQRLLAEYNVGAGGLDGPSDWAARVLGPPMRRVHAFRRRLGGLLGDFFFVRTLWVPTYDARADAAGQGLEVCGAPHNVDLAEHVWEVVHRAGESSWARWRMDEGPQRPYARLQFLDGVVRGFHDHLAHTRGTPRQARALVWSGDPALEAWMGRRHPRVRRLTWAGAPASAPRRAGQEAGAALRVRPAVRTSSRGGPRRLTGARPEGQG